MAYVDSPSYQGRYFRFEVNQGTNTAINWTFSVNGGAVDYYSTSAITCQIGGHTVLEYPQSDWQQKNELPWARGSKSGTYDPGHYGTFEIRLTGQPYYYATPSNTTSITTVSPYEMATQTFTTSSKNNTTGNTSANTRTVDG